MTTPASARRPPRSEEGVTAVEYGLLIALIAAVIFLLISQLGTQLIDVFSTAASWFKPDEG